MMIEKQLQQLSKYITSIEQQKPLDFFCKQIQLIEQKTDNLSFSSKDIKPIHSEFNSLIKSYEKQGISIETLILTLYEQLLSLTKKQAIHSYAYELGIEPTLYKNKMRFLFKGKTK